MWITNYIRVIYKTHYEISSFWWRGKYNIGEAHSQSKFQWQETTSSFSSYILDFIMTFHYFLCCCAQGIQKGYCTERQEVLWRTCLIVWQKQKISWKSFFHLTIYYMEVSFCSQEKTSWLYKCSEEILAEWKVILINKWIKNTNNFFFFNVPPRLVTVSVTSKRQLFNRVTHERATRTFVYLQYISWIHFWHTIMLGTSRQ